MGQEPAWSVYRNSNSGDLQASKAYLKVEQGNAIVMLFTYPPPPWLSLAIDTLPAGQLLEMQSEPPSHLPDIDISLGCNGVWCIKPTACVCIGRRTAKYFVTTGTVLP